jgi:MFS family permease
LSLIFCIIIFITAFIYKEPKNHLEEQIIVPIDERIKAIPQREQVNFPLFLPLFVIGIYGFLIGSIGLVYPVKSETLNFELFTNYMFGFFRMSTQTISISITMDFTIRKLKKIIPWTMLITFFSIFFMGLNQNLVIFGILFCLFGMFASFMYTLTFKLILFRNIANNTSKYSVYFETLIGVGFFLAPIVSGFIAAWNVDFSFYFLSILTAITLFVILVLGKKVKE